MTADRNTPSGGRAVSALMLLVMALWSLLPPGVMPLARDGVTELVLCSGMGERTVLIDAEGRELPLGTEAQDKQPCPFAAHAAPLLAPDGTPLPLAITGLAGRLLSRPGAAQLADALAETPPVRGPPALV